MPHGFCRRCRRGDVGRKPKFVNIGRVPLATALSPEPSVVGAPIYIELAELEALRLVEVEKASYEDAGIAMGVSRNTIWRLVENGKEKLILAFFNSRRIEIHREQSPGDFQEMAGEYDTGGDCGAEP